ncbi:DNA-binding transcriptional LysR family regulator [Paraburkholderia sp. GAS33]|uniref:LysR substrate-binding domain-containing protein n=1 Tax=Paraburkholderia sp. GAS33 TaxID=3035130 RepID=UPI003D1CB83B
MSTLRFLRTFVAIAEHGSFAAAAERVALTHAAVGQQMRALESELGRPLFSREKRSITLRPEAYQLLPQVRQLLADYEGIVAGDKTENNVAGHVSIGAIVSGMGLLSKCLVEVAQVHPALEVTLATGRSSDLIVRVGSGELDAAVVIEDSRRPFRGIGWTHLYDEPLVLLANRGQIRRKDDFDSLLETSPFIRYDRATATGAQIERLLRRVGTRPRQILELDSILGISELVRQGVGVAIVPMLAHSGWHKDPALRVFPVPDGTYSRRVGMLEPSRKGHITGIIRQHLVGIMGNPC